MKLEVAFQPQTLNIGLGNPVVRDFVDRDPYAGDYTVTPSNEAIVLQTDGKRMTDNVTVKAIQPITGTKQISIVENGTVSEDVADYATAEITVNVPTPALDSLAVTENGTYEPTSGHAYNRVSVSVPVPTLTTLTAVDNGTYTPASGSAYSSVEVAIPSAVGVSF